MMKKLFHYFHPLEKIIRKQQRFLKLKALPVLWHDLISSYCPTMLVPSQDMKYVVLDIETTGFDCTEDNILSLGWVEITQGKIGLHSAYHCYINNESQVKAETAVINQITPQMLSEGIDIEEAMTHFFNVSKGKIIVAHGCVMEKQFLEHYIKNKYGLLSPPLLWIDTLCIEKQIAIARNQQQEIDLTLAGSRARYQLPEYNGHNALVDAVATAELLLAQQKRLMTKAGLTFAELYKISHSSFNG